MVPDLIYDVGFNKGNDTRYYLSKGYRVVAVEADPTLAEAGRRAFADAIAAGRLTLLNVGVADADGVLPFYVNDTHSEWSSFVESIASRGGKYHAVDVLCRRFGGLLAEHGVPFYLKIDIEGHDTMCLRAIDPADAPRYVSYEAGEVENLGLLVSLGYDRFKCIDQIDHRRPVEVGVDDSLAGYAKRRLRRHPKLRSAADVMGLPAAARAAGRLLRPTPPAPAEPPSEGEAPWGDSGPFGEETPGPWVSAEEAAHQWLHAAAGKEDPHSPYYAVWHDIHAARPA